MSRQDDETTRGRRIERQINQHTAGATREQEGGARSDLVSSKTTTRTTADRDTGVWDPTQRRVGGRIDQRTAGTGFGVIGRAVRVGLTLFGYKRWGREQRHRGTDDDERGCQGEGGIGGMGPGREGVEEDAAVVRQWRREGKSAYHNAPVAVAVAVAVAIAVIVGDNNIGVPGNQGRGPTQENARCNTVHRDRTTTSGTHSRGRRYVPHGMRGWVALEREYARLATPTTTMEANDEYGIRAGRIDRRQIKTNYSKADAGDGQSPPPSSTPV